MRNTAFIGKDHSTLNRFPVGAVPSLHTTAFLGDFVPDVLIESLAHGGDGVGRLPDGRTVFVAASCPGDRVAVEIIADKSSYAKARITDVVEASADRVAPPCPYFGICGGCAWQHISQAAQARAKRQAVVDSLTRIGGITDAEQRVASLVPSAREYGYRNKIELVAEHRGKGGLRLGFHGVDGSIVTVDSCMLLPKAYAKAPKALSGALRYISGDRDLGVFRVGLRVAAHTRDAEIAVWTPPGAFQRAAAAKTLSDALNCTSIVRVLSKGEPAERRVDGVEVLSGKGHWRERLHGATMAISAPSFFQVNTRAAEELIRLVLEGVGPDATHVVDAYAGAGTFTLPLADAFEMVTAVEASGAALRDLRRNLEANSLYADVIGGDAARELAHIERPDAIVIDPPRAGLSAAAADALSTSAAPCIIYVSCDPATLARDAALLGKSGYSLERATPVDLFPQTYHVETVAIFRA
jgi:23S rRNA (uracil1939-C5)-methyltransferase